MTRKRHRKASAAAAVKTRAPTEHELETTIWSAIVKFQRHEFDKLLNKNEAIVRAVIASGNSELIRQVDGILASSCATGAAGGTRDGEHAGAHRSFACRESDQ
jgi:hypothetical protein